tara:strand:+ start:74 stop:514 length:441 start_codon:yes stop_codon:yes gene_type:complete
MQKYEKGRGLNIVTQGAAGGSGEGDITFIGSGVSTVAGRVYVLQDDGEGGQTWYAADNNDDSRYEGLLAVALTTNSSGGMLLRGAVTMTDTISQIGNPVYLSPTPGRVVSAKPTATGQVIRVLGYGLNVGSNTMYFNPDNTYITLG